MLGNGVGCAFSFSFDLLTIDGVLAFDIFFLLYTYSIHHKRYTCPPIWAIHDHNWYKNTVFTPAISSFVNTEVKKIPYMTSQPKYKALMIGQ